MGEIVKRKKKGRPSKADLARRSASLAVNSSSPATDSDIRRSLRRRNVKYTNIDYQDYEDYYEEDSDDDVDEKRRAKKLKLLLKLPNHEDDDTDRNVHEGSARDVHAPQSEEEDDDEDNDLRGGGGGDEQNGRQHGSKGHDSVPGTPPRPPSDIPITDKKTLELILDKLQKKDIYGVYAEPVDPDELPDYHEIIENPMDFATVREKLNNDTYTTLKQLASDIDLICSNAMQYNAADTVYHKQARTIEEMARKKFLKIRIKYERSEKERKSEQKTISNSNSLPKKQIKRLVCQTSQEPVGSDFSSGATLATVGDVLNSMNITQPYVGEKPSILDGFIEGNSSMVDKNLEKTEELQSGKGLLTKFGRKPLMLGENRRTTYNISSQSMAKSESIFTTFDGEQKQLVSVGLHTEHSYSRSLARFAATLGPCAWNTASKRIEKALPEGFKFGRGWVGEYEPLPAPILMIKNSHHKEPAFFQKAHSIPNSATVDRPYNTSERPTSVHTSEGKPSMYGSNGGYSVEAKPSFFGFNGTRSSDQQKPPYKSDDVPEKKTFNQNKANLPSTTQNKASFVAEKPLSNHPKMAASKAITAAVSRDMSIHPQNVPIKKQNNNGTVSAGLSDGKVINNSVPNKITRVGTYGQEQNISNPTHLTRIIPGKTQKQTTSTSTNDLPPVISVSSSTRSDDPNNAAQAAARAWMSIGASGGGFKSIVTENSNPTRNQNYPAFNLHPQMLQFHVSGQNSFPGQVIVPQQQFQNRPNTVFPHLVTADLSRFHVQTPWRGGCSPRTTQQRQKQDTLPPDLNISFQSSSGSPVGQSAGGGDSQQPDLALQL